MTSYARRCAIQLLRDLGIPVSVKPGRPRALTAAQEAQALERLRRGDHTESVAARWGVSRQTMRRIRLRAKLVPRGTNTQTKVNYQTQQATP